MTEPMGVRLEKWWRERLMWALEPYWGGCWCDLVMWAMFPSLHERRELMAMAKGPPQQCVNDVQGPPWACYCGRYKIDGPTSWGNSESIVWDRRTALAEESE